MRAVLEYLYMFADPEKVISQIYLAEGMTVADLGAGIGFYSLILARKVGPYGKVFAVDVQKDYLRKVKNEAERAGFENVEVIQGDLEMPKGSGLVSASIDRVLISNILFQSAYPENIVKEAKRVLKHDGKIAIVDWSDSFNQLGPHPDHVITKEETQKLFEKNGLQFESFLDAGSHHYGMIFRLPPLANPAKSAIQESAWQSSVRETIAQEALHDSDLNNKIKK